MTGIFAEYAPKYWAAGLPVIPLKKWNDPSKGAGKAPFLSEWQQYATAMPSKSMQEHWIHSYPDNNVGLPLGAASGLFAIDIDSEDPDVVQAIVDALPKSPWVRVGKKGMVLVYKWNGAKNFKLRDSENRSIVEFLGHGNQVVVPASIHPDTGQAYTANCNLWDVIDKVPAIFGDVEKILREALEPMMGKQGLSLASTGRSKPLQVVPQGERDIQLVRHAGYLARVVLGIDKGERFTLAQAIEHMHTWVEEYTASISGDSLDPDKGVAKLLEFLMRDLEQGKTMPDGWAEGLTAAQLEHPTIAAMIGHNESARWNRKRAMEWLSEKFSERPEDDQWALQCVNEIITTVAKDDNFNDLEFSILIGDMQKMVGKTMKLSKPDLKKAFREARRGDGGDMAKDHAEIASYMLEVLGRSGEVRHDMGSFWQWNGSCFGALSNEEVYESIAMEVKGNVLSRRHNDYLAIVKVMAVLANKELVEEFEPGVNFANGYLGVDGKLHEHSPKWGATFTMPFEYVPERAGECHKWLEFLETSWGDDVDYADKVAALQESFAVAMFGLGWKYQRAVLLFGKAGAGKTVALDVLRELMPVDAVCSIPPHVWREKFTLPPMVGKSLNICGELPERKGIAGDIFKQIVCGEPLQIERKGQDPFNFKPKASHWFASNFLPKSSDTSRGFTRRWLILEFNHVVKAEDIIRDFASILVSDEREAIAAWAVLGMARVLKNSDFTLPASHDRRVEQVMRGNNSVAAWLLQSPRVRPVVGEVADARDVFDHYIQYMKDVSRGFSVSFERFKEMVGELGHEEEIYEEPFTGIVKYQFRGLMIKNDSAEDKWDKTGNVIAIKS